jgi:hypothetical protein
MTMMSGGPAELERELSGIEPLAVDDAIGLLAAEDVVSVGGEIARVSRCARHLDALGLIGV